MSVASINTGGSVHAPSPRLTLEDRSQDLVEERLGSARGKRTVGELQGRHEERRPGEPAAPLVRLLEPPEQPRHGDGCLTHVEDLGRRVGEVDLDLVHLPAPIRRDGEEAVQDGGITAGLVEQEKPAARGARERALGDERGERRGQRGVDARAPLGERPGSRLGGVPVSRCNRAAHGEKRRALRLRRLQRAASG